MATDPRIIVPSGMRDVTGIRLRMLNDQWGFYGPYQTLAAGRWLARAVLSSNVCIGNGTLEVCSGRGRHVIAHQDINLNPSGPHLSNLDLSFYLDRTTANIEFRWFCKSVDSLGVDRIELVPVD
jgi:hypothetical protein